MGPAGFLRRMGGGPPFGVVEGGPDGGPAGDALMIAATSVQQQSLPGAQIAGAGGALDCALSF